MGKYRTRIMFAPDILKLEELAVNWDNVVRDIQDHLEGQGLHWQRNIGYVADRELTTAELQKIFNEINAIAVDCLLYLNSESIGEVRDLTHLFKAAETEES